MFSLNRIKENFLSTSFYSLLFIQGCRNYEKELNQNKNFYYIVNSFSLCVLISLR